MDDEILYTTTKQQIELLKTQQLIIEDEEYVKNQLQLYGYFNIIKGYRDPYIFNSNGKVLYRSGVTFEQIHSLYILDKNLRNGVIAAMLDLEEHIKAVAADVIAESFGTHQSEYMQFKNYRDKKRRKPEFSLSGILKTMQKSLNTDKNPVLHYRKSHGIIPPWVLFKNLYFSTIVNFINLFKPAQHIKMATYLYNTEKLTISIDDLRKVMMDTLFICLEYRNLAAHGGRTYNHRCNSKLRSDSLFKNNDDTLYGFSQLLYLLKLLKYQNPYNTLDKILESEVNRHCQQFPEDVTYLGQILNMDIILQKVVYTTDSSNIFHSIQHCSGIKNPKMIEIEDALNKNYIPCKKCCK